MTETTPHPAALYAYFGYRDAHAAIEWLGRAFGFETTMRFPDDNGGVAHAELRLGNAAIVVFSDRDGYQRPPRKGDTMGFGTYLSLPEAADVDAVHARAFAVGATGIWEPGTIEWGNYRCRVLDPRASSERSGHTAPENRTTTGPRARGTTPKTTAPATDDPWSEVPAAAADVALGAGPWRERVARGGCPAPLPQGYGHQRPWARPGGRQCAKMRGWRDRTTPTGAEPCSASVRRPHGRLR